MYIIALYTTSIMYMCVYLKVCAYLCELVDKLQGSMA